MILFYILFFVGISSAIFVLTSNNMIYSTLSLILVFISSSLLMLLLKADFLGYLFIIVYVGAVSILFLFVVMNLSIQEDEFLYTSQSKNNFLDKLLFIFFLSFFFFISFLVFTDPLFTPNSLNSSINYNIFWWYSNAINNNSIYAISSTLYTYNALLLIISSFMLLVAMIGSIALTLEKSTFNLKQNSQDQIWQELRKTITLFKVNKR